MITTSQINNTLTPRDNRNNWLKAACVLYHGFCLPGIDQIKTHNLTIIRDGHHRNSVVRIVGSDSNNARVTEWVLED